MTNKAAKTATALTDRLPAIGVAAFALGSTWALFNMFHGHATHPSLLYWVPAIMVELVTAWLVSIGVRATREVTKSLGGKKGTSQQDRRFWRVVLVLVIALCVPTVGASVAANLLEFEGNWWLSLLFPAGCVACAIAGVLPEIMEQHSRQDDTELARENTDLRAKLKKAREARALVGPTPGDVARVCAELGSNGAKVTASRVNLALAHAGLEPLPESTLRHQLSKEASQ